MSSAISLLTRIDRLFEQIQDVTVLKEYWRIIAKQLRQLRYRLNAIIMKTRIDPYKKIAPLVELLEQITIQCSADSSVSENIRHRELESLLLHLHWRISQYEVHLIDDYHTKLKTLTDTYHEQKMLKQQMNRRKRTAQSRSAEAADKSSDPLRIEYTETIGYYLRRCIDMHKSIPFHILKNEAIMKVAHHFYQYSSDGRPDIVTGWEGFDLPLLRSFIRLTPEKHSSFERMASQYLLVGSDFHFLQDQDRKTQRTRTLFQNLTSAPVTLNNNEESIDGMTILQTGGCIAILGDPGSGKTTFTRWLVRQLAERLLGEVQRSTDLGPLRVPILIRIAEFADALRRDPSLTLFNHIGHHTWMGQAMVNDLSISSNPLSSELHSLVEQGQALILLDGLDEVTTFDQRLEIIYQIENFVEAYAATLTKSSVIDQASKGRGNQIIVTSRRIGYQSAPLPDLFIHYTIAPMAIEQVKDFIDYWYDHVHRRMMDTFGLSSKNHGENHGKILQSVLEKEENLDLREMASNIWSLSLLCSAAFEHCRDPSLPIQRIELYQSMVNAMLNGWSMKDQTMHRSKLIVLLSDIAMYIQQHSVSALIHEEQLKEISLQSIQAFYDQKEHREMDFHELISQFNQFLQLIRYDAGIFTARGTCLYGFLHPKFQQYLTGLNLIKVSDVSDEKHVHFLLPSLQSYLNDPRFCAAIAFALWNLSCSSSNAELNHVCLDLIQTHDKSESLLPMGAFALIDQADGFIHHPSEEILFDALDHLMIAAGRYRWSLVCPFLFDRLAFALSKFPTSLVQQWIHRFLSKSPSHDAKTISALCYFLEGRLDQMSYMNWLDQSSCELLQSFSGLDDESNQFAIDRLLVKLSFVNHHLLPVLPNTFKEFLITQEIPSSSIPPFLFPIIIILYGGLKREDQAIIFDPAHIYREASVVTRILVRFISKEDLNEAYQNQINIEKHLWNALQEHIDANDQSSEIVDLCIATLCLKGIEAVRKNEKEIPHTLLNNSLHRFKYISMILREFYFPNNPTDRFTERQTTSFISGMVESSALDQRFKSLILTVLDSLKSALARLRSSTTSTLFRETSIPSQRVTLMLPTSLRPESAIFQRLMTNDVEFANGQHSCSLLPRFTRYFWLLEHDDLFNTPARLGLAMDTIPGCLLYNHVDDLLFPLVFVPRHLQNLYIRLLEKNAILIHSTDKTMHEEMYLCFSHFLVECFLTLSDASCRGYPVLCALVALLPMLIRYRLESFGSSLLWTQAESDLNLLQRFETFKQSRIQDNVTDASPSRPMSEQERQQLIKRYIQIEHQRFRTALIDRDSTGLTSYAACISLAAICKWADEARKLKLLEESIRGAMAIESKLVRLDALSIILYYSHSEYHRIVVSRERSLQQEIEYQFNMIVPDLPLLLHTTIFIRCLPLLQHQATFELCLKSLHKKLASATPQDQRVVYEALSPYFPSKHSIFHDYGTKMDRPSEVQTMSERSIALKECLTLDPYRHIVNASFAASLLIASMYLVELGSEIHGSIEKDDHWLPISDIEVLTKDESVMITKLFHLRSSILTVTQAATITNLLSTNVSLNRCKYSKRFWFVLNNELHHFHSVEFKACQLIENWMKWKDASELSLLAFHAALLLTQSNFWSVEAATILCDLLYHENDRFRQKAEIILRSKSRHHIRTSSRLDIDVLLTLTKKIAHFQQTSPFAKLTLSRMFDYITLDIQSHLETFLWLERYRIHALMANRTLMNKLHTSPISPFASYFPSETTLNVSFCGHIRNISEDLLPWMCEQIESNFLSFLDIGGDVTSQLVLESHIQFVISIIVSLATLSTYNDVARAMRIDSLLKLIENSTNKAIREAAAYAIGYILDPIACKKVFDRLQILVNKAVHDTSNQSDGLISALVTSYCHYKAVSLINLDQQDIDLLRQLLKYPSSSVVNAVQIGLARLIKDTSVLFDMVEADDIRCYHALMGSTAYFFVYDVQRRCAQNTAQFIEEHPEILHIFLVELYNSIRHFTREVTYRETVENIIAYGYPQYVEVASLIALRMPAAFIACVKECGYEDELKQALFFTSKQHDFRRRGACLTILSTFGELTVELCEMLIEGLCHDLHLQNTCYQCLPRIYMLNDEKAVRDRLFSYLKSKSIVVRYAATKVLLHCSRTSLIPFDQVRGVLGELMSDPSSEEDLWLIEDQEDPLTETLYYYVGPFKDVIYFLLVQHLTGDASRLLPRKEFSDIDLDFLQSEKAARLAACLYEETQEENVHSEELFQSGGGHHHDDSNSDKPTRDHSSPIFHKSDETKDPSTDATPLARANSPDQNSPPSVPQSKPTETKSSGVCAIL